MRNEHAASGAPAVLDEALDHYRQSLRLKPDFAETHYGLAIALGLKGDVDEAIQHCREAIRRVAWSRCCVTMLT